MKFNKIFLLFLLWITLGCSNNEPKSFLANIAKNIIKTNDSLESIVAFADDKKIILGLNKNLIFNIITITNDTPDIEAIVLYLVNLSENLKINITTENEEKTKSNTKLKIGKIQLLHTEILDNKTDSFSKNTTLLIDGKEIYNSTSTASTASISTKIKTNLTEKQLLDLLKENGLNITIVAYAKDKKSKSIINC